MLVRAFLGCTLNASLHANVSTSDLVHLLLDVVQATLTYHLAFTGLAFANERALVDANLTQCLSLLLRAHLLHWVFGLAFLFFACFVGICSDSWQALALVLSLWSLI